MLPRFYIFLMILFPMGCFWRSPAPVDAPVNGDSADVRREMSRKDEAPKDEGLLQVVKAALQGDQIVREAWWVVANERRNAPRSPFGKMQRAAQSETDGKLSTKTGFSCDRYEIKKVSRSFHFFETCIRDSNKEFAKWHLVSANSARVEFFPEHLSDVLGLNASIFTKRIQCELSWNSSGILTRLSCPGWEQDRGSQLVRLTQMEYLSGGSSILKLRGQVLEQLQPVRKIEADVPMEGKIVVTETELAPAVPEETPSPLPLSPVRQGAPPAGAVYADPTVKAPPEGRAPVNPDLLQQGGNAGAPPPPTEGPAAPLSPEDEMIQEGMVPLLNPDGTPMLSPAGEPLWGRPSVRDGMIFVPDEEEPEPEEPAAPPKTGNPMPEPDYQGPPPSR